MISGNINGNSFSIYTYGEIMYDFWSGGVYAPTGHVCWRPSSASGRLLYYSDTSIHSSIISGGDVDCTPYIPNLCFSNCTWKNIGINLPSTTEWINGMFMNCSTLQMATLYNCSRIGSGTFGSCHNLSKVQANDCIVIEDAAFIDCPALKYISLPKCSFIGSAAFQGCRALERLNLPKLRAFIASAFFGCSSLSRITFGYSDVVSVWFVSPWGLPFTYPNTKIDSNIGAIYVPSSLVSRYKSDSTWSYYSDIIRSIQS